MPPLVDRRTAAWKAARVVEQWWDGWIGALLAAAVTVGATVWWDAHVRRRERLEDAVVRLHEAATQLATEVERVKLRTGRPEELAAAHTAMGNALLLVRGLALRRVLHLPARLSGPSRSGLGATVDWLFSRWNQVSLVQDRSGKPRRPTDIVETCWAVSTVCHVWLEKPMTFWPGRQRGPEYLKEARSFGK